MYTIGKGSPVTYPRTSLRKLVLPPAQTLKEGTAKNVGKGQQSGVGDNHAQVIFLPCCELVVMAGAIWCPA